MRHKITKQLQQHIENVIDAHVVITTFQIIKWKVIRWRWYALLNLVSMLLQHKERNMFESLHMQLVTYQWGYLESFSGPLFLFYMDWAKLMVRIAPH